MTKFFFLLRDIGAFLVERHHPAADYDLQPGRKYVKAGVHVYPGRTESFPWSDLAGVTFEVKGERFHAGG
jgi:hypothetical protein